MKIAILVFEIINLYEEYYGHMRVFFSTDL